jgi:hypothetical protein
MKPTVKHVQVTGFNLQHQNKKISLPPSKEDNWITGNGNYQRSLLGWSLRLRKRVRKTSEEMAFQSEEAVGIKFWHVLQLWEEASGWRTASNREWGAKWAVIYSWPCAFPRVIFPVPPIFWLRFCLPCRSLMRKRKLSSCSLKWFCLCKYYNVFVN